MVPYLSTHHLSRKVRYLTAGVQGLSRGLGEDYDPGMSIVRFRSGLAIAAASLLVLTGCAQEEEPSGSQTASADECSKDQLPLKQEGTLTIGTDKPAYEPWFVDNDPTNGEGYESAVAYAIAEQLGYTAEQVAWVKVPFNEALYGQNFDAKLVEQRAVAIEEREARRLRRDDCLGVESLSVELREVE